MVGIFAIVTTEILPIGLLLPIAAEFSLTAGISGVMMTVPGIVAAVAAPLAIAFTRTSDRRTMLLVWMGLLAASWRCHWAPCSVSRSAPSLPTSPVGGRRSSS
jgi:predicted MFS family arabinose efflux permease